MITSQEIKESLKLKQALNSDNPDVSESDLIALLSATHCPKCETKLHLVALWYKLGCSPVGIKGVCAKCDCEYTAAPRTTFVIKAA